MMIRVELPSFHDGFDSYIVLRQNKNVNRLIFGLTCKALTTITFNTITNRHKQVVIDPMDTYQVEKFKKETRKSGEKAATRI
jgi:hypothetical protein